MFDDSAELADDDACLENLQRGSGGGAEVLAVRGRGRGQVSAGGRLTSRAKIVAMPTSHQLASTVSLLDIVISSSLRDK